MITKGRSEEAYAVFVKYHAEGDADSEFARAEMAQVQSTLNTEAEIKKQSWSDMFRTAGMRRRVLIASALGLFTQWSGNTLQAYYLSDILKMIGQTSSTFFSVEIDLLYQRSNCLSQLFAGATKDMWIYWNIPTCSIFQLSQTNSKYGSLAFFPLPRPHQALCGMVYYSQI